MSSRSSRTSSPYSVTEAVGDLTTDIAGTDTKTLNQSLDTLSQTIDAVAPQLGPTFEGVTRLSRALNARNQTLGDLFKNVSDVSAILSQRRQQVNTLILDGNDLVSRAGGSSVRRSSSCSVTPRLSPRSYPVGARQRSKACTHAGQTQRGDRGAGKEPRQHL